MSEPFSNPDDEAIRQLLRRVRTIAVVGLSSREQRPSFGVARYLQQAGYRVIPVNPNEREVLGERAAPDLSHLPGEVDLVDVFRSPEHVPAIVEECLELGLEALWLQEGVIAPEAAGQARNAGMSVVMDRCMMKEYRRLA